MILLLLACTPKAPPAVFAEPFPRVEVPEIEVVPLEPGECVTERAVGPGEPVPCEGVLVPGGGPHGFGAYLQHQTRDEALTSAIRACYTHRVYDRAYCEDRFTDAWTAYQAAEREARLRRIAGPVGFVGGVVLGLGTALGVYWAADGL